jgi:hypothetical protein
MRELFTFPNPVNEITARFVAGGVVLMALAAVLLDLKWMTIVLAYGFVARVAAGPRFSPLAQLVQKVIIPRSGIEPVYVAGPPKRFAQTIGAVFSITAAILWIGFGLAFEAKIVLSALIFAATLESVFRVCLGCQAFALLIRAGVIPEEVCERCANIWGSDGPPPQVEAPA